MKVLHLLQSNRFSGAENVVCQIIGMFRGDPNIEMVYSSRDGQIREALEERGIAFAPMSHLCIEEVRRVIREQKPDIIHAHDMRASYIAARVCGRIKLISHIHNNAFDSRGISVKSIAYLLAAKKAKHIFWVSKSAYNGYVFHGCFKKKSSVLYNIISIPELYKKMELDTQSYGYDMAYVGRLSDPKNPQRLMRVLKKVAEQAPDVKIGIVGSGNLEDETKALCHELGLDRNVDFLGFKSNPLKLLHDARVMVMTSRYEGTPMCALESMALGVPIVSTPTDGLCELVDDGVNGYLSDDDDALAAGILKLIRDKQLQSEFSNNIREKAEKLNDIEAYREAISKSYQ
ncbi:MAG: glycosyltransferase [Clostridia bacterium]|nr:glycosyltransferase [Clostridia bacterium]